MVKGFAPRLRAEPKVTPLELLILTPPLPGKEEINSPPVVCAELPVYWRVALAPYTSVPVTVVVDVPSIERTPFTVVVPEGNVLAFDPRRFRLEYVVGLTVWVPEAV
jgi:hypothetical protein